MKSITSIKKFTIVVKQVHRHIVFIWMGYGIFNALTPYISLYLSAQILNQLLAKQFHTAFQSALFMCILLLITSLLTKLFYNRIQVVRRTAAKGIDQALLKKAMELEYERLEMQETMDTLRRTRISISGSGDIGSAIWFMSCCFDHVFRILFALLVLVALMIKIHTWDMYFVLLLGVLFIFLFAKNRFAKQRGALLAKLFEVNDRNNGMLQYLSEIFHDMKTAKEIRLYQMQTFYSTLNKKYMSEPHFIEFGKANGRLNFYDSFVSQALAFASYVYVASLALRSIISIGQVLYISGVILNSVNAIADFQHDYAQLCHQLTYLNEFYDFLKIPNMHYEGTLPIEKRDDKQYAFEFDHVSFRYPGSEQDVLHNVSINFQVNEKLAIVGCNGAGKTTIVKLLCRLYEPTSGTIRLNGIDIKKYDYKEYTSIFSVVFQDFKLFSYELDENIAGCTNVDKIRLREVLERLGLKDKVEGFYDKETSLLYKDNGDGVNVSGGEAQKLAIARALYKDAPFVILDEPTAALDPISEAEIYENFNVLVEDKTTLYISHRMSSCQFCDRILVMNNGELCEEGNHEELLSHHHVYEKLWNAQAQYYTK